MTKRIKNRQSQARAQAGPELEPVRPLFKNTIVIWSNEPTHDLEMREIVKAVEDADPNYHLAKFAVDRVEHPESDADWDDDARRALNREPQDRPGDEPDRGPTP